MSKNNFDICKHSAPIYSRLDVALIFSTLKKYDDAKQEKWDDVGWVDMNWIFLPFHSCVCECISWSSTSYIKSFFEPLRFFALKRVCNAHSQMKRTRSWMLLLMLFTHHNMSYHALPLKSVVPGSFEKNFIVCCTLKDLTKNALENILNLKNKISLELFFEELRIKYVKNWKLKKF